MRRASILHSFNSSPEGQSDTCSTRTLLQNSIQYELLALLSHTTSLREVIKSTSSRTYCSVPHRIVQLRRDGPTHRLPYGLEGLPNSAEQRTHDVGLVLLFGMVGPIARRVIDAMPSLSPYHAKGRARRCIARQLALRRRRHRGGRWRRHGHRSGQRRGHRQAERRRRRVRRNGSIRPSVVVVRQRRVDQVALAEAAVTARALEVVRAVVVTVGGGELRALPPGATDEQSTPLVARGLADARGCSTLAV